MTQQRIHQHEIRVYTEDVDYMGIVYHANYLRYFERSRTEMLREKKLLLSNLIKLDVLFVINELAIQYKLPAKMDDLLTITTEIKKIRTCSFVFEQLMKNENNKLLCEAKIQVVCVDSQLKPKRLPDTMNF